VFKNIDTDSVVNGLFLLILAILCIGAIAGKFCGVW
jgi:hypothetical protein